MNSDIYKKAFRVFLLFVLALLAGCSQPPTVETTTPTRGLLEEAFRERARTRLARDYPVTLPVSGRIGRIDLEPGDRVRMGQRLVEFDAFPVRNRVEADREAVAELQAQLDSARDLRAERAEKARAQQALQAAQAELETLEVQRRAQVVEARQAQRDLERSRALVEAGAQPARELEMAQLKARGVGLAIAQIERQKKAAKARISEARAQLHTLEQQMAVKLDQSRALEARIAQAQTAVARSQYEVNRSEIVSPIDGVVLERKQQGPKELPAGTELLLLGQVQDLEAISEVLSQDALRLQLGDSVELAPGNAGFDLAGEVVEIEPAGFTKLSSLGVEQQRVNVILALKDPPPALGIGYELNARFVTEVKENALKIPRFSVLQDEKGQYYVLVVKGETLEKRVIRLGIKGEQEMEVLEGLSDNETLVRTPDTTLTDGQQVQLQNS